MNASGLPIWMKLAVQALLTVALGVYVSWMLLGQLKQRRAQAALERAGHGVPGANRIRLRLAIPAALFAAGLGCLMAFKPDLFSQLERWSKLVPIAIVGLFLMLAGTVYLRQRGLRTRVNRALAVRDAGDLPGSLAMLRAELARVSPLRDPQRYSMLASIIGAVLSEAGDKQGALEELRRHAVHFPGDGGWTAILARATAEAGNRAEAMELFGKALEQTPHDAMIRVGVAEQLIADGRSIEAADRLRQAEELLAAYPQSQAVPRKAIEEAVARLRAVAGESTRAFEVRFEGLNVPVAERAGIPKS